MTEVTIIPNKWRVKVDSLNHQLVKYSAGGKLVKVAGKEHITEPKWSALDSFHPNMEQAIKKIISLEMEEADVATLEEYLALQVKTAHKITEMIKEVV